MKQPLLPFVASFALFLGACAIPGTPGATDGSRGRNSRFITAEQIESSGARDAWDALQRLTHVSLSETSQGTATGARMRGRSSLLLDETPVVVIDGVKTSDLSALNRIQARRILRIELLSGSEATYRFGTGSAGGAIVVTTH